MTAPIHAALAEKDLLPCQHIVDAGYIDADLLVTSGPDYGIELCGPVHEDNSSQAAAQQGFDAAHFTIDWAMETVTCPQGRRVTGGSPRTIATATRWCISPSRGRIVWPVRCASSVRGLRPVAAASPCAPRRNITRSRRRESSNTARTSRRRMRSGLGSKGRSRKGSRSVAFGGRAILGRRARTCSMSSWRQH
jgi:hypothetical protein